MNSSNGSLVQISQDNEFGAKSMPIWIALLIEVLEQGTFDNLLLSNISCSKTSTSEMIQRGTDLAAIFFFLIIMKKWKYITTLIIKISLFIHEIVFRRIDFLFVELR